MFVNSCQSFDLMFECKFTIMDYSELDIVMFLMDKGWTMYVLLFISATPRNTFARVVWMILDILLVMFLCFVFFILQVIKLAIFVSITRFMQGNTDLFTPARGSMIDLVLAEVLLLISSFLWRNKCYFALF